MILPKIMMAGLMILAISVLAQPTYADAIPPDPCSGVLPQQLEQVIKKDYPGWEVMTLRHLPDWWQLEYEKKGQRSCPGVAKVNFYGDGRVTYALVLLKASGIMIKDGDVLLAQLDKSGRWTLTMLWDVGYACDLVVVPAKKYRDFYGEKQFEARARA